MKKLTFIISVFTAISVASCTCSSPREASIYQMLRESRDSLRYYKTIYKDMNRDLHAYEKYFESTEILLDSLGIEEDAPIFKTQTGINYLNAAQTVKNLQNTK